MSDVEKYAVRYNIIVIAEALSALALHIARRLYGEEPETTIHAFNVLRDKGLITPVERDGFARLVRLRNLLVHRYWVVDDEKIYMSIKSNKFCKGSEELVNNTKAIYKHLSMCSENFPRSDRGEKCFKPTKMWYSIRVAIKTFTT